MSLTSETRKIVADNGKDWIEEATVHFQGKAFTAGGAAVVGKSACGYPKQLSDGSIVLTDFQGNVIGTHGTCRTFTQWFHHKLTMYAFTFQIEGKRYSGRNGGLFGGYGCLVNLRTRA